MNRRIANAARDARRRIMAAATPDLPPAQLFYGTVTAYDGTVTSVSVQGAEIDAPRLAHYTAPAVGDRVAVLVSNGAALILDVVTGFIPAE